MTWDPFGTIGTTLWIGGAQWAGKSTIARILARRHGVTAYHYDYHDARGHYDRLIARHVRRGEAWKEPDPESMWVRHSPEEMAHEVLDGFSERFEWTLDDLRGLVSGRPVVAEGWGLRPELVAPLLDSPDRMLVMVPTEEFRAYQLATLPRAQALSAPLSDPERGQRNRIARDRIIAEDAVGSARRLGIRVLEVDGSHDAEEIATAVAHHFAAYLPTDPCAAAAAPSTADARGSV
ncbi:hypothetical protein [Actinopolymorpha alba]|uniref:hypothetical protein n=1 Tax=Actinopolymorpha alba TaxID=533267 RepID=UPI000377C284|nr:hypothetical protein [Actinopolymorpha alba]